MLQHACQVLRFLCVCLSQSGYMPLNVRIDANSSIQNPRGVAVPKHLALKLEANGSHRPHIKSQGKSHKEGQEFQGQG